MEQPSKTTVILIGISLTVAMILLAFIIALSQQATTPDQPSKEFKQSEEYWNQVYVSEYLAEKTFNGSAHVLRAGLGRVVVEVDGRAYEYKCEGAFNCTEGFVFNETQFRYIGRRDNGTEGISN